MLADDVVEGAVRNTLFFRNIDAWVHGSVLSDGEKCTYELNAQGGRASVSDICYNTRARLRSAVYPPKTELSFARLRDGIIAGSISNCLATPYGYTASAMRSRFCARVGNREYSRAGSVWEKTVQAIKSVHIRAHEVQLSVLDRMWSTVWAERYAVLAHIRAVTAAACNA